MKLVECEFDLTEDEKLDFSLGYNKINTADIQTDFFKIKNIKTLDDDSKKMLYFKAINDIRAEGEFLINKAMGNIREKYNIPDTKSIEIRNGKCFFWEDDKC